MSISRRTGASTRCATRSTRICGRIRSRCSRPRRCADGFDARFSAKKRHYLYRIVEPPRPIWRSSALRAWRVPRRLDADGDARGRAAPHRQARLHDVPLDRMPGEVAGEDARPARRDARRRRGAHRDVGALVPAQSGALDGRLAGAGRRRQMERRRSGRRARGARPRGCGPVAPPEGLYLVRVDY